MMIVRQYEIKDECSEVTILASGDIKYNNVTLNAKFEGTVEKFYKIKEPIGYTVPQIYDKLRHPINNYKKDRYDIYNRCLVGSTNQAESSGFSFRIA